MRSAGPLGTPPRNYSPLALFSSTARERHAAGAHPFGDRHVYASVIAVECTTSTPDEQAAQPPLMREEAMHLRSRSLCIFDSGRMHHQKPRREGGEAAPDAGEGVAPEIAISMHLR
jgi:hypothetical protein